MVSIVPGNIGIKEAVMGAATSLTGALFQMCIRDRVYGARPLKRYMQSHLETMLARKIVAGDVLPGQTVRVDVDANGELTVSAENMAMQP